MKGKRVGRDFERKVRAILKEEFFVYTKGVSTPGPDILAIKYPVLLLAELKTYKTMSKKRMEILASSLLEHLNDYIEREAKKSMLKVYVALAIIEIRREKKIYVFTNNTEPIVTTTKGLLETIKNIIHVKKNVA